jgi:hypothetical protein
MSGPDHPVPAPESTFERLREYFSRPVAEKAASSLANGVQIELRVSEELFTFTRRGSQNVVEEGAASSPEIRFTITPQALEAILAEESEDIATIGIHIMKLVVSTDANRRVAVQFQAGFLKLWSKGYFGVLKSGGSQFAQHLASLGLSGMDAIKAALSNLKK